MEHCGDAAVHLKAGDTIVLEYPLADHLDANVAPKTETCSTIDVKP